MADTPRQRNVSLRSLVYSIDGPERAYPVYRLPIVDKYERPGHNPFTPGAFAIEAATPPAGMTTVEYPDFRFTATFGKSPLVWTVVSGSLPPGLVLEPDGRITGTPTGSSGSPYAFTVRVTDDDGQTDDLATSISVSARVQISQNPLYLPEGIVGEVYPTQTFTATGGTGPYTWAIVEGHIHDGLTFTAGVIDGTPTNSSDRGPIRVQVTDANGYTDSIVREIRVREPAPPPPEEPPGGGTIPLTLDLEVGVSGGGNYGYDERNPGAGGHGEFRPHTLNGFRVNSFHINGSGSFIINIYDEDLLGIGGDDPAELFESVVIDGNTYNVADAFYSTTAIGGRALWLWSGAASIAAQLGNIIPVTFNMKPDAPSGTVSPKSYYRMDWKAAADAEAAEFVTLQNQGGLVTYNGTFTAAAIRNWDLTNGFGFDTENPTNAGGNAELQGGNANGKGVIAGQFYHAPTTILTAEQPLDFTSGVLAGDPQDGLTFDGISIKFDGSLTGSYVDDDLLLNATIILRDRNGVAPDVILTEYQNTNSAADNYLGKTLAKASVGGLPGLNDYPIDYPAAGTGLDGHTGWDFTNDWYPVLQVTWQNPSGAAANDSLQIDVRTIHFWLYRNG